MLSADFSYYLFYVMFIAATIKSTVDACDVTDHELGGLVAGLLEV